jgi:ethanolamine transporter EutH
VAVTVTVLPVMRPLEASSMTLEEMEGTSLTGQTVSVRTMVSVTVAVLRASLGKLEKSSVLVGQSMTSGRHEVIVRIEVVESVRVVIAAGSVTAGSVTAGPVTVGVTPASAEVVVADSVKVLPVMRPLEASSRTLDEMEGTAVTGQTVSVRMTVSVTVAVVRDSLGRLAMSSVFAGQSVTTGRHEVMVRIEVVDTVRVVTAPAVPLVGRGAAVVTPVPKGTVTVSETSAASSPGETMMPAVPLLCLPRRM